ncbi:MAG: hypothetical protein KAQ98_01800 [Bacteriovoracaceae bacterium]|nr:hypothetical protein [Bacteriovoracaceae bacterium]
MGYAEGFWNKIDDFISNEIAKNDLDKYSIVLGRQDGVLVFNHVSVENFDLHAVGALMAGMWQAAGAISNFLSNPMDSNEYRMGFDTTSQGIYILPVQILHEQFFLGIFYQDIQNPGFLKAKVRFLIKKLEEYCKKTNISDNIKNKEKEEYLFQDITDHEMNRLFMFAES